MKKVKYCELDAENKLSVIHQVLIINTQSAYPYGKIWHYDYHLINDLEQDYDIDSDFIFLLNEHNEVYVEYRTP